MSGRVMLLPALLITVAMSASAPEPVLTTWLRGPNHLVANAPAAMRLIAQRSTSETDLGPFPDASFELTLSGKNRSAVLFTGTAGANGEASARFTTPDWPDGDYALVVTARHGKQVRTNQTTVTLTPSAKLLLRSDKPLYQPGQTIHLRTLAMRPFDTRPITAPVRIEVYDSAQHRVFVETKPSSKFGVASFDVPLGPEVALGSWKVVAVSEGAGSAGHELELKIERYSLPKFKVALSTDRGWYRPAEKVTLRLDARYFFGKPVAGVAVVKLAAGDDAYTATEVATATLDGEGRARVDLTLPKDASATMTVLAQVTDTANHVERSSQRLTVSSTGAQLELISEAPKVVSRVANRFFAVLARPDGSPVRDTPVTLAAAGQTLEAKTDSLGIASFELTPNLPERSSSLQLTASATVAGERIAAALQTPQVTAVAAETFGPLRLRTDRALYALGAPIGLEVRSLPGVSGVVLVDVVKAGLTVDTARIEVKDGRGTLSLAPDERRFGTIQLQAYWSGATHTRDDGSRDQRLIYVDRPSALKVEVRAQRSDGSSAAQFAPGEQGKLALKVVDAATGAPAQASVGVLMVDEALLALRPMRASMARAFFQLSAEAMKSKAKSTPGGIKLDELVERGGSDDVSDRAARVLLAGAAPPWDVGFSADGFAELVGEARLRQERLAEAGDRVRTGHQLIERVPASSRWRWRSDLMTYLVQAKLLRAQDVRDPWGRPLSVNDLVMNLGTPGEWAETEAGERLTTLYRRLAADQRAGRLTTVKSEKKTTVTLTDADLARVTPEGKPESVDPWGSPWRLSERKKIRLIGGVRSAWVVMSNGPDGLPDTADDLFPGDASGYGELRVYGVRGDASGYGAGGLGLRGTGAGGGGAFGGALGGVGSFSLKGGAAVRVGAAMVGRGPARLRSDFPETLLWAPEVLTDARGEALIDVSYADSITTWALAADAVSEDGRLGSTSMQVKVMQDFFVDLDLPPVVTQHDELAVPVAVYNYLKTPQQLTLTLAEHDGFTAMDEKTQRLELGAGEVGVRYFRVRAEKVGSRALTIDARGSSASDRIRRGVEVFPDGVEQVAAFSNQLEGGKQYVHPLVMPRSAIEGTPRARLKVYPGMGAQAIDGLENMLRMPSGCFEQSSSATYPNALILQHLRRTKKATPEVEAKVKALLATGYQKLVSYEVGGSGGFSWFGDAPANVVLTAYGLEEFTDMSKVFPVDPAMLARIRAFLLSKQQSDGRFEAVASPINEGATNHFNRDTVRTTAYVALALHRGGAPKEPLLKAARYVQAHLDADADAYSLALAHELSSRLGLSSAYGDRLWNLKQVDAKGAHFPEAKGGTLTYGAGKSGEVETTARAALALLSSSSSAQRTEQAVKYLVGSKDSLGNWYSTQATIRSLQVLLEHDAASAKERKGEVVVSVDGADVQTIAIDGLDAVQSFELPATVLSGEHQVGVRFAGSGAVSYQLVAGHFAPRGTDEVAAQPLQVKTLVSQGEVKLGGSLTQTVEVTSAQAMVMPVVRAGVPPGFHVDDGALEQLVQKHVIDKYERTPREVIFYLTKLDAGRPLRLSLPLTARMPAKVQVPPATVYEYYRPENTASGLPILLTAQM